MLENRMVEMKADKMVAQSVARKENHSVEETVVQLVELMGAKMTG